MKKNTSKKILNYGAMSAAILAGANASGQIIFTDLDPDQEIGPASESFMIDVNDDGTNDFDFQIFNSAGTVMFALNTNGFVGFTGPSAYYYPSNLAEGTIIDETSPALTSVRGDFNFNSCNYPSSQWCDGNDGYVGLILDVAGETHYGWALVNVTTPGNVATIREFAYESTPDTAIAAGDDALSLEDNSIDGFTSFVDANSILQLNAGVPFNNISIYNISGQEVLSRVLTNTSESVDINALSTGAYIARVGVEGTETAIKFVKQ